jgi:hypothetical protein
MKLEFELDGPKGQYHSVKVFFYHRGGITDPLPMPEFLEESQYNRMAEWCAKTFHTETQVLRARRMSYDSFWFSSKRDLNWFVLYWSGVDSAAV